VSFTQRQPLGVDIARVRCAPDRVTPWVKESCEVLKRHTVGWISRLMELVGPSHSDGRTAGTS